MRVKGGERIVKDGRGRKFERAREKQMKVGLSIVAFRGGSLSPAWSMPVGVKSWVCGPQAKENMKNRGALKKRREREREREGQKAGFP